MPNKSPFIPPEVIDELGGAHEPKPRDSDGEDLPPAPRPARATIFRGVGSSGCLVARTACSLYRAAGLDLVIGGMDSYEQPAVGGILGPRPGFSFSAPHTLWLTADDAVQRARDLYPSEAWAALMRGTPVYDRSPQAGWYGHRNLGQASLAAEIDRYRSWVRSPLVDISSPVKSSTGADFFRNLRREMHRVTSIWACSTTGATGSTALLPGMALERRMAEELRIELKQYAVLVGGRVFGVGTANQVHERAAINERAFFAELAHAHRLGRVQVGAGILDLERTLFAPGSVLLFDEDLRGAGYGGPVEDRDREAYIQQVGITVATAVSAGILEDAEARENARIEPDRIVRGLRIAAIAFDRADLAARVASARQAEIHQSIRQLLAGAA